MTKPYYQDDYVTIYHGDSRELLPEMPRVDLVLTDPPYGINYNPARHKKYDWSVSSFGRIKNDNNKYDLKWLFEMETNLIIWGAENMWKNIPEKGRWICWHKLPFGNDGKMRVGDFELAWTNKKTGHYKMFHIVHNGVINANSNSGAKNDPRMHPTEKPISLMAACINTFKDVETILDPFMGSGTTLRAAKDLGRKAIGIEIEEKYCEIAAKRMAQEVLNFGT